MERSVLQIVAAVAVLSLYYYTLFLRPVTLEAVSAEPGSLSVEESRELLDESRMLLGVRELPFHFGLGEEFLEPAFRLRAVLVIEFGHPVRQLGV